MKMLMMRNKPAPATAAVVSAGAHGGVGVDLALPKDKTATTMTEFARQWPRPRTVAQISGREYAIGSSTKEQQIYYREDLGLFPAVYEAWKNHWNLRTSPEDWWSAVACRIAKHIDKAAKADRDGKVRDLFVNHEGKETICVDVDVFTIDQVDYQSFFSAMASEITGRIKVPAYAKAMQNDFSTSTTTHCVASQINLMASMQEFFDYEMRLCGCGIKGVEMLGKQEDWDKLVVKIQQLKKELEPIMGHFEMRYELGGTEWFDHVELVFRKLAETFSMQNSINISSNTKKTEICDFWADIFMIGDGWKYGPSGFGGHAAKKYNGWLVHFLTGRKEMLEETFLSRDNKEKMKGLNTVPMKITMKYKSPEVSDMCQLQAGLMGFRVHHRDATTFNSVPSVQPCHMWAMKLPPCSPLRETSN